ncbi:formate--tetrahydrofolate ligase [Superficieibacter electus]|uniref:Formate--tetrahydrofolate ligase n=1 Tax=Superficieibacter electus TaxID=2022662 RepID=A0A2P5GP27_9ENTR|nr:formate--tetrahydrofolate ligase [Superficieibacter electus]POP48284.1 formate--tetrahydrofolate ligase [Superficieibacter electus]
MPFTIAQRWQGFQVIGKHSTVQCKKITSKTWHKYQDVQLRRMTWR